MQLTCCKHSLRIEPIRPASRHAFCYSFSMETLPSVCPLDCPDRCALDVTVEGGRLVKIDGSDRSEYTDGYICAKVRRFDRRVYSPERVLHPMKRIGPKGSGRFERISWPEAIRTIADRFSELIRTLGPESILPFHYDGSNGLISSGAMDERFWNRLGASQLARTFCAANTGAAWSAVFGDMAGADPIDLRHSDAILLWGFNPSASGIHLIPWVREAQAAGRIGNDHILEVLFWPSLILDGHPWRGKRTFTSRSCRGSMLPSRWPRSAPPMKRISSIAPSSIDGRAEVIN